MRGKGSIKVHAVGGYSEVGKNMTVVEFEDDAFLFDIGFYLPAIVSMQERDKVMTEKRLTAVGAIPDDSVISHIRDKVCAQFTTHAHLDHVGGIPYMSDKYNAPIYGTPFSIEVIDSLLLDNDVTLKNKMMKVKPNTSFYVQGKTRKYRVDFINITHSTIQTVMIAVHTPKGVILYANDFKMDDTPVLGLKPNYKMLEEVAKEGILCFVVDSLYSGTDRKTPSEKIARALLEEVMMGVKKDAGMLVTSFSSHIARLKSVVDFGRKIDREVVFMGRSLAKYSKAAMNAEAAPFLKDVTINTYRKQVEKSFAKVNKNKSKYLVVCTGHQGEPGAILERLSRKQLPYKIDSTDNLIFSSSVIPTQVNIDQFAKMEGRLKKFKP
ncbi:MAG: ribonuclease J, partial [Patescibacteria group bacterium]